MIHRLRFAPLPTLLAAILLAPRASGLPAAGERPNVLLIMTDDQGYPDLSCHGNPILRTPHLDRLHAQSLRLTDYHVDPTCSPTRAALMTGRDSTRTGVWHTIMGRSVMHPDEKTLAEHLRENGYRTGMFGKWHLGDAYPCRPQDQGFECSLHHGGGGVSQTPDWFGNDYFDDTYYHAGPDRPAEALEGYPGRQGTPVPVEGYCTDVWFDACMDFCAADDERPFFAYLATNVPHFPNLVAESYWKPFAEAGLKEGVAKFYGMLAQFDECMGRLLAFLDERGLAEDTLLLFTTDNGSAVGHFPGQLRGRKGSQYDGGHRVPFFLRWPGGGLDAGVDHDFLCAHIDVLPTVLELCGLPPAEGPRLDGRSLAPVLLGQAEPPADRTLFVHSQRIEHPQKWRKCAVMTERWRLVDGRQLFDVQADPMQEVERQDEHPEVVAALRAAYEQWWRSLEPALQRDVHFVVGDPRQNPTRLTAHDWHGSRVPWDQGHVRQRGESNGDFFVEVARAGSYRITLRALPAEDPGALQAKAASVSIGGATARVDTEPDAESATLVLRLAAGRTRLRTTLHGVDGKDRGACFVLIERLGDGP